MVMKPWKLALALTLQVSVASSALAQYSGEPVPPERNWYRCPSNEKPLSRYYPKKAQRLGIEGTAKIQCRILATGTPYECVWLAEPVLDLGFGSAAERLGCLLKFKNTPRDEATGSLMIMVMPMRFQLPPEAEAQ